MMHQAVKVNYIVDPTRSQWRTGSVTCCSCSVLQCMYGAYYYVVVLRSYVEYTWTVY